MIIPTPLSTTCSPAHPTPRRGFTLVEALVVISIIALLIGLLLPALARARRSAWATTAQVNIRQLQMAHLAYTNDHKGQVLPGYRIPDGDRWTGRAYDNDGNRLSPLEASRYPWRLAKWFSWNWKLLYHHTPTPEEDLDFFRGTGQINENDIPYLKSVFPQFGLNVRFVGGSSSWSAFTYDNSGKNIGVDRWGAFYVRIVSDAANPARQIVFADSIYTPAEQTLANRFDSPGFHEVDPPFFAERNWNLDVPEEQRSAADVGHLMPRYDRKVTVSFLDGHAEALTMEELDDMRLWAPLARSRDYLVTDGQ